MRARAVQADPVKSPAAAPKVRSRGMRRPVYTQRPGAPGDPCESPHPTSSAQVSAPRLTIRGVHHVALICENLEWSMDFYCGLLGLEINPDRPDSKLPYR